MRIELGRRADYAIRAVVDLARNAGNGRRKARAIADTMAIPASFLPQILADLVRAGLVRSEAGRVGGYDLARGPAQISLLDVVEAVEIDTADSTCVLRGGPCRWEDMCAVHVPWAQAKQALTDSLAATSLADLVAIDQALESGHYVLPEGLHRPAGPAPHWSTDENGPPPATASGDT